MALGPPRARGSARAVAQGHMLQWGVGGTTGGAAAAALWLPLAPSVARTVAGGPLQPHPPPPDPQEGQQGPREPMGDTRCLPRERGGWRTRATLHPTPVPGPQRASLAPCRPAARLFYTGRMDQEVADGDEVEGGGPGTRPWTPLPPSRNTSAGTTLSPWFAGGTAGPPWCSRAAPSGEAWPTRPEPWAPPLAAFQGSAPPGTPSRSLERVVAV